MSATDNSPDGPGRRAQTWGRVQIIALAVMFFGPALLAWIMVLNDWRPSATTNHGRLVQPPEKMVTDGWRWASGAALREDWFTGHWTWLVPIDGPCGSACEGMLDVLRRARIALDKDADRVEIVTLQPAGAPLPSSEFRGLRSALAPARSVRSLLPDDAQRGVSVVDYQAFRMMAYPVPLDGSGLLDDMERLLKLANERVERYQRLQKQTDDTADGAAAH